MSNSNETDDFTSDDDHEDQSIPGKKVDNELYNIMNIGRNATQEEIASAYKKLSRSEFCNYLCCIPKSHLYLIP